MSELTREQLDEIQRIYSEWIGPRGIAFSSLDKLQALLPALIDAASDGLYYAEFKAAWIKMTRVVNFDPLDVLSAAQRGIECDAMVDAVFGYDKPVVRPDSRAASDGTADGGGDE